MDNLLLGICKSFLAVNLGYAAIFSAPAWSQTAESKSRSTIDNYPLAVHQAISTQAKDLYLQQQYSLDNSSNSDRNYQIAQNELNREEFCREYPFNSLCSEASPNDSQTIPVPVPPPAPPGSTGNDAQNSSVERDRGNKQKSGLAIVPEVSTLGLGGHIVQKITPRLNGRVGFNTFGFGFDIDDTDADYEGDLSLSNVSAIIDLHPFKNSGFKLSGGLIFSSNTIEGTANADQTIEIGDQTFNASELGSVDADVDITNDVSPYLGLGWGNAVGISKSFGFWLNAGVLFGGSPDVDISPNIVSGVPAEVEAEINAAVEAEEAELEDEIGFLDIYPVVSLGVSYQF